GQGRHLLSGEHGLRLATRTHPAPCAACPRGLTPPLTGGSERPALPLPPRGLVARTVAVTPAGRSRHLGPARSAPPAGAPGSAAGGCTPGLGRGAPQLGESPRPRKNGRIAGCRGLQPPAVGAVTRGSRGCRGGREGAEDQPARRHHAFPAGAAAPEARRSPEGGRARLLPARPRRPPRPEKRRPPSGPQACCPAPGPSATLEAAARQARPRPGPPRAPPQAAPGRALRPRAPCSGRLAAAAARRGHGRGGRARRAALLPEPRPRGVPGATWRSGCRRGPPAAAPPNADAGARSPLPPARAGPGRAAPGGLAAPRPGPQPPPAAALRPLLPGGLQGPDPVPRPADLRPVLKVSLLNERHKYDDVEYEEEAAAPDEGLVRKCTEWLRGVESAAAARDRAEPVDTLPHLSTL
ncbi:hypothetical protein MC885_021685, partial [Smutsia gigantea]